MNNLINNKIKDLEFENSLLHLIVKTSFKLLDDLFDQLKSKDEEIKLLKSKLKK